MTTPYAETEALLAIMDGDTEKARGLVSGFHPSELQSFKNQLWELHGMICDVEDQIQDPPRRPKARHAARNPRETK